MATALTSLALGSVAARPREVKPPLVKIRTIFQRGEAPEILDVEANLDPLEILKAAGVGILVGGVALAAGWLLWDGLAAPTPIGPVQVFRGVKESAFWREEAEKAKTALQGSLEHRRQCKDLKIGYEKLLAIAEAQDDDSVRAEAEKFRQKAFELGCRWAS